MLVSLIRVSDMVLAYWKTMNISYGECLTMDNLALNLNKAQIQISDKIMKLK